MSVSEMEELVPEEMGPQGRRQRRVIVAILGTLLTIAVCVILGATFVQGSWWYAYSTDRLLDDEAIARVEAIHHLAEVSGVAPEAVRALEAALEPSVHPSDVRMHLILAQERRPGVGRGSPGTGRDHPDDAKAARLQRDKNPLHYHAGAA